MDPQNPNEVPNLAVEEGKSMGPAIGIVVIIAVIVIGGLYFWGQRAVKQDSIQTSLEETSTTTTDQNIQNLQKQSSSDDVDSIEGDLNATNLDQLGNEMNGIEAGASASSAAQ